MFLLIDDGQQRKALVEAAKVCAVACLSQRLKLLLFGVLDYTLGQDTSIEPADGFINRYWSVIGCDCDGALFQDGHD